MTFSVTACLPVDIICLWCVSSCPPENNSLSLSLIFSMWSMKSSCVQDDSEHCISKSHIHAFYMSVCWNDTVYVVHTVTSACFTWNCITWHLERVSEVASAMKDEAAALVRAVSSSTAVLASVSIFRNWVIVARRPLWAVKLTQRRLVKQLISSLCGEAGLMLKLCWKKMSKFVPKIFFSLHVICCVIDYLKCFAKYKFLLFLWMK